MMARMAAPTTMTAPPNSLPNNNLPLLGVQEKRQESSPSKEDRLHNPHRKSRLQHRTRFINMQRERIIRANTILAKRAQRNPDRASVPV